MRIAVNTRVLIHNKMEGVGWYINEVVKRMALNHPEDEFILIFDAPYDKSFIYSDNIIPVVIGPPARHPILWYLWFEWSLPIIFRKYKPDVFFSTDGHCSLSSDISTLMTTHDIAYVHYPNQVNWLVRKFYQVFVPKYLKRANHIVAVSDFVKSDIINRFGISADKITTVHNGARKEFHVIPTEEQDFIRSKYSKGKAYLLYNGSIHPRKNVLNLIKAFELFKKRTQSDLLLLLVGRMAWQTEEVNDKLKTSVYKDDIIHIGYVAEELNKIVASAKAVVYISYFEGFGLPVLEAFASGVPVITSNITSMPEVAGDAAITVDPDNLDEIANAMKSITSDQSLRSDLIEKGLNRAKDFSWDKSAEMIYNILKNLVGKSS